MKSKKKGKFIVFEGPEGSGKGTQIRMFSEHLNEKKIEHILTREPGGTAIGEKIRNILLDPGNKKMCAKTEAYLYAASRAQHIKEIIMPALKKGVTVVSDRFVDSSIIYQGYARDLGMDNVLALNQDAISGLYPDICFVIMIPVKVGLLRAKKEGVKKGFTGGDRLEKEEITFHEKVYEGFLKLSDIRKNVFIIDGSRSKGSVHKDIIEIFENEY